MEKINVRKNNIKIAIAFMLVFVLNISIVMAHGEETFAKAEAIIESKVPCEDLSEEELEALGDYYMEQMHPGEAHERMDEMMGGEGSETLKAMHIRMALAFYCGQHELLEGNMMGMMMGRNMMGSDNVLSNTGGMRGGNGMMNRRSYSMMGNPYIWSNVLWYLNIALAAFIFGIIFWWTKQLVQKRGKTKGKKRK